MNYETSPSLIFKNFYCFRRIETNSQQMRSERNVGFKLQRREGLRLQVH